LTSQQQKLLYGLGESFEGYDRSAPLQSVPTYRRRDVILDRIVESLNEKGTTETDWNMTQLAKAANTSRVTLYQYFGDLEGVREAVRTRLVGEIDTIVETLDRVSADEQRELAVSTWMKWIDDNRELAIRALLMGEAAPAFAMFAQENRELLVRQVAEIYLGLKEPSLALTHQLEVYLGAAEHTLRLWLLEGRMERHEVIEAFDRILRDVVRMGEERDDVPKPLPGHG
jgi:AcrR family transcriptional regulator